MICEKCKEKHNGMFGSGRFCSRYCANSRIQSETTKEKNRQAHLGENNPMYGRKQKRSSKDKIRKGNIGKHTTEKNGKWKGNSVSYAGRHYRIIAVKGKASNYKCVGDGINQCNRQAYHWSNKDHKYSLTPDDYLPRCNSCHQKYDNKFICKNKYQE